MDHEREHLEGLIARGSMAARKASHARILLHADEDCDAGYFKDEDIAYDEAVADMNILPKDEWDEKVADCSSRRRAVCKGIASPRQNRSKWSF